ncbi:MAG: rRNA maturation RNase YbeY [Cyanobacteriota bacterium]|nr:rRNA maturation RNase YbeY [Cyanobacteriota bacterium]
MSAVLSSPNLFELHVQGSDPDFLDLIAPRLWQDWGQVWLDSLPEELPPAPGYELTLRLTDDEEMTALNAQFRQTAQTTDVLAFAALDGELPALPDAEPLYLGDIVISVPQAQRQARERGHDLSYELAWLAAHGLLHLLGWDHPDEASLTAMLACQESLLTRIGLDPPEETLGVAPP